MASTSVPASLPAAPPADGAGARAAGDDDDAALMRAYVAGDTAAFARLYDRHERAAWRFIRHRLGPAHEAAADDVLQETWISVARAAERYVATARFTTWLMTIARNKVIDHLRTVDASTVSLDAPAPGQDADDAGDGDAAGWAARLPGDAADEPVARVQTRQQARDFLAALDQLPGDQREAFVLQVEGGLSVEEVAAATGVGAETAKSRLRYARTKLRALLSAWSPA